MEIFPEVTLSSWEPGWPHVNQHWHIRKSPLEAPKENDHDGPEVRDMVLGGRG